MEPTRDKRATIENLCSAEYTRAQLKACLPFLDLNEVQRLAELRATEEGQAQLAAAEIEIDKRFQK
jgi:hypothetical protein